MKTSFAAVILFIFIFSLSPAQVRPVHTYSIVARDSARRNGSGRPVALVLGGSPRPVAEAGVGAVVTQSFVDPVYGPRP
jgi:hypothetical protein